MATLKIPRLKSPIGKMGVGRSWSLFSRPRKTMYLFASLAFVYLLLVSWNNARNLASALRKADLIKDDRGVGVVLQFGGIEIQSPSADGFDENQLPFDDVNVTQRKSDEDIRQEFDKEYNEAGRKPGAGKLYGGTLSNLVPSKNGRHSDSVQLTRWKTSPSFSSERPYKMDPYPNYNSWSWRRSGKARYVACKGPLDRSAEDVSVSAFKGLPAGFPSPSIGSYSLFDIDQDLCYERDTRLGIYALPHGTRDNIDWGDVQIDCIDRNQARFDLVGPPNDLVKTVYGDLSGEDGSKGGKIRRRAAAQDTDSATDGAGRPPSSTKIREQRTAILLRSYTGKKYTENDRYIIRALVSELNLRSGGEYQVFLLVHVKDEKVNLWDNQTYEKYLQTAVPKEFIGMTLLWNDDFVQETYPKLEKSYEASVHNAQWLSVQKFMQEFREFSFVWNWEMDARITGHAYDMLEKLGSFARQQPRRGLWERNERYYIPGYHGDYDTEFRQSVEAMSHKHAVWGPPSEDAPFINPIGPHPPTDSPQEDKKFEWGVGEDADLITLSPLFDPKDSGWVLGGQVWNYNDANHSSESLPRRGAIVTQCRLSRRLLDIMHVENLRGNHVGSEMAPGTVALLHGLKAVYAPMPIFMDRPMTPERLARWFNNGPRGGSSGGPDSAMGWGREGRFRGTTWYYRADPPQRLYSNWVGYEDNGVGGLEWEMAHGRPCLPAMFLHPVKDVVPTSPGYGSESRLPY